MFRKKLKELLSPFQRNRIRNRPTLSDDQKRYQTIERGDFARRLLTDELFVQAYQELLDDTFDKMMATVPRETEVVKQTHLELWALQSLVQRLNSWHQAAQLIHEEEKKQSTELKESA
jgi:uncharacterized membrane protein